MQKLLGDGCIDVSTRRVINESLFISGHCLEPAFLARIITLFVTKTVLLLLLLLLLLN